MSIYTLDIDIISTSLTPPKLRMPKQLAWLMVLFKPLKSFYENSFIKFKEGSIYNVYSGVTNYTFGNRVIYSDRSTYELIVPTSIGINPLNTTNWVKLNDVFIACDERVKYSSQKILFEYSLNKFFMTSGIYITNNFVDTGNVFVMNNSNDDSSSTMPLNSVYQDDYMGLDVAYNTDVYDYTINFPIADYASLGSDADGIIRTFADNYNLSGMQYNILTF